jgi:hypothetical protein
VMEGDGDGKGNCMSDVDGEKLGNP